MRGICLQVLDAWSPLAVLRTSTILYASVNALHILGLGMLLGAEGHFG